MSKTEEVKANEEMMMLFQQEMQSLQQRLGDVEQKLAELNILKKSLKALEENKEQEILFPVGVGVLIRTNVIGEKKVLVNVGSDVIVEKSFEDAKRIMDEQIVELKNIRTEFEKEMNDIFSKFS